MLCNQEVNQVEAYIQEGQQGIQFIYRGSIKQQFIDRGSIRQTVQSQGSIRQLFITGKSLRYNLTASGSIWYIVHSYKVNQKPVYIQRINQIYSSYLEGQSDIQFIDRVQSDRQFIAKVNQVDSSLLRQQFNAKRSNLKTVYLASTL